MYMQMYELVHKYSLMKYMQICLILRNVTGLINVEVSGTNKKSLLNTKVVYKLRNHAATNTNCQLY